MAKISLKKALKIKNAKIENLATLKERFLQNNQYEVGQTPPYNSEESLATYELEVQSLVKLKSLIHEANIPVYGKIFELSELKTELLFLKTLETRDGKLRTPYSNTEPPIMAVTISRVKRDGLLDSIKSKMEILQEHLDEFNSITKIEWE